MLLVDKVKVKIVFVGADLVTNAALPRTLFPVQRLVQEEHPTLLEQNLAVVAAIELSLRLVVHQHIVQTGNVPRKTDSVVLGAGILTRLGTRDGHVQLRDVLRALYHPLQGGKKLRQICRGVRRRSDRGRVLLIRER